MDTECKYCEGNEPLLKGITLNYEIDVQNKDGEYYMRMSANDLEESKSINFCPMCGRTL